MGVTIKNSRISINDYHDDISKGLNSEEVYLNVAGLNPDIDSGTEDLWPVGGALQYLSSQEKMNIASTSLNDAAAGTGVQSIFISGLNDAGVEVSESVVMNVRACALARARCRESAGKSLNCCMYIGV